MLWTHQPGLGRLAIMTGASIAFFTVQIVMAHLTHSLTLLAASYHMFYNILSLVGCITTIKMCQRVSSISNTFGWARLEVLSMVVNLLFLFALNFSILVEVLQTLIHSDHMDAMHQPDIICIVAFLGILLNGICTLMIGGYTHLQGSFLALTPHGDVVIQHGAATEEAVRLGLRRLAPPAVERHNSLDCAGHQHHHAADEIQEEEDSPALGALSVGNKGDTRVSQRWPTMRSVIRDNASSVIVLISGVVVYVNGESLTSVLLDPLLTLVIVAILYYTSYPFMIQAAQILLQTTPAHIDVTELQSKLKGAFPSVVDIHDLHVWALTPDKVISTAHLVFMNENVYLEVKEAISDFFLSQGITRITLQPEFYKFGNQTPAQNRRCVLTCNKEECSARTCCSHQAAPKDVIKPTDDVEHHGSSCGHSHDTTCGKNSSTVAVLSSDTTDSIRGDDHHHDHHHAQEEHSEHSEVDQHSTDGSSCDGHDHGHDGTTENPSSHP